VSQLSWQGGLHGLQTAFTVTPILSGQGVNVIGFFGGRVPTTVVGVGGKSARIQFGHACSLLIFASDAPQKAQCFLVDIG